MDLGVWRRKRATDASDGLRKGGEREADDRKVVAVDPLDERCGEPLNAVRAGFVESVAARRICGDRLFIKIGKSDPRRHQLGERPGRPVVAECERGVDGMPATGK